MNELFQHADILIFLVTSIAVVLIFQRLKISSILGYLLAGVLIGPHVGNLITQVEFSKTLAEFGVIFLLFTIGLELPWERLRELKRYVFGMGLLQVFTTALIFGLLIFGLSHSIEMSIILGGGLAISSTAVVLQVLSERNELMSRTGRIAFSILIIQDLAVVILLVWINTMAKSGGDVLITLAQTALRAIIVLVAIGFVGRFILRPLYRIVSLTRNTEVFMATSLLIILATGTATAAANLSMELGAFLAGIMLAETEYRHQIEADIKPFRSLLLGLFFMTVGMSINPAVLSSQWTFILAMTAIIIIAKFFIIFSLSKLFQIPTKNAIRLGFLLSTGSEFIFVIFSEALQENIVSTELMQVVNLSVIISMALTPFLVLLGRLISRRFTPAIGVAIKAAEEESRDMKNHVIIAGYGRVGQTVHQLLSDHVVPHYILDINMAKVAIGRKEEDAPIFFGDARRAEVYRALGAERAKAVIITLSEFAASTRAVMTVRRYFPNIEVFVRVRDSSQAYKLREIGARPIMPETFAPSFQLAAAVLSLFGVSGEQIDHTIKVFRKNYLSGEAFDKGEVPWLPENPSTPDTAQDKNS